MDQLSKQYRACNYKSMVLAPATVNESSVNTIQAEALLLLMTPQTSLTLIQPTTAQMALILMILVYGFRSLKNTSSWVVSCPCVSQVVIRASNSQALNYLGCNLLGVCTSAKLLQCIIHKDWLYFQILCILHDSRLESREATLFDTFYFILISFLNVEVFIKHCMRLKHCNSFVSHCTKGILNNLTKSLSYSRLIMRLQVH